MFTTDSDLLERRAQEHLAFLCGIEGGRPVGSRGNRIAGEYIQTVLADLGYHTETQDFSCLDWDPGRTSLEIAGESFPAEASPLSVGTKLSLPLVSAERVEELESWASEGQRLSQHVLLLRGCLSSRQLFPKNFPFFSDPDHQRIYALLEKLRPKAIIAATGSDPEVAGGLSPFPLFEDGGFDIPSVYITEEDGHRIGALLDGGSVVAELSMSCRRRGSQGWNVLGRLGSGERVLVAAHYDAKPGTAGAVDNGTGVCLVLLLAELLVNLEDAPSLELLFLNGEDYYNAPGQTRWLNSTDQSENPFLAALNVDGVAVDGFEDQVSVYGVSSATEECARQAFGSIGEQWFQGDHSMFIQQGIPALALTSRAVDGPLLQEIAHTPKDNLSVANVRTLVRTTLKTADFLRGLSRGSRAVRSS